MPNFLTSMPGFVKSLALLAVFTMASCQKEATAPEGAAEDLPLVAASRTNELENLVLHEFQWIITHAAQLASDAGASEDLRAGNTSSARLTARLLEMGFTGYDDFVQQFAANTGGVRQALQSGVLNQQSLIEILLRRKSELEISGKGGVVSAPDLPCYDQFLTNLAGVALAVTAASGTLIGAVGAGIIGVTMATLAYYDCLQENYPNAL